LTRRKGNRGKGGNGGAAVRPNSLQKKRREEKKSVTTEWRGKGKILKRALPIEAFWEEPGTSNRNADLIASLHQKKKRRVKATRRIKIKKPEGGAMDDRKGWGEKPTWSDPVISSNHVPREKKYPQVPGAARGEINSSKNIGNEERETGEKKTKSHPS